MPAKRPRYRYITSQTISPAQSVASYDLHSANQLTAENMSAVRFAVPRGMNVKYAPAHKCSHTSDERTLDALDYDIIVRMRGRWKVMNELKGVQPYKHADALHAMGYQATPVGYKKMQKGKSK